VLERFDGHATLRNKLRVVAQSRSEWAGIPMPLEGERLVVEPRYPFAGLGNIGQEPEEERDWKVRNTFWSTRHRVQVVVFQEANGRVRKGILPGVHNLEKQLRTLGCAEAWGVEQESNAVRTLGTLVAHRQLKQYLLTGSFLETSKRTGLVYLFRRLRPTVVIEQNFKRNTTHVRCTLCMHPIAYYEDSWAGAMCPTDDVIAALMMMRGDEPMFWRKANQHPPGRPEAGL
jgi:hypothetical protein